MGHDFSGMAKALSPNGKRPGAEAAIPHWTGSVGFENCQRQNFRNSHEEAANGFHQSGLFTRSCLKH
jgi:hypothetical protein